MMPILLVSAVLPLLVMGTLWFFAWKYHRIDIIDVGWAGSIALCACLYLLTLSEVNLRTLVVVACPLFWAVRLSAHLIERFGKSPEDPRYAQYREQWGKDAKRNFLFLYLFQGALSFILSLAILAALAVPADYLRLPDLLALGIFVIAFSLEWLADHQLKQCKQDPSRKEKTCRKGLWNYSRHPNYFFEWMKWLAYVFFAFGGELWWLSFIGVAAMYYFLVYLTGIPPSEKRALESRGDEYRKYQSEVNAFFPWPRNHR